MKWVVILIRWHAHSRETAMEKETAVRLHVVGGWLRLAEHRLHGDVPAAKGCRPDLLSLKRQHDKLTHTVFQLDGRHAAVIEEEFSLQRSTLDEQTLLFRKEMRVQRNLDRRPRFIRHSHA